MCKENSTKAGISVGKVTSLKEVKPGIYHLVLKTNLVHQDFSIPQSGQFYMLRSTTSKVLLSIVSGMGNTWQTCAPEWMTTCSRAMN